MQYKKSYKKCLIYFIIYKKYNIRKKKCKPFKIIRIIMIINVFVGIK